MRRVIVVSDTHHDLHTLLKVVKCHPEAELIIHLGDGYSEIVTLRENFPERDIRLVRGNCDFDAPDSVPISDFIEVGAARVFCTHGHHYGVKEDLKKIHLAGRERGANVILYGHTHVSEVEYHDGIYLMNPGSLGQPRLGNKTYGVIDIDNRTVFCHLSNVPKN